MYMWHSDDRVGLDTLYATRRTAQTSDNVAHLGNSRRLCMHDEIVQWSRGGMVYQRRHLDVICDVSITLTVREVSGHHRIGTVVGVTTRLHTVRVGSSGGPESDH